MESLGRGDHFLIAPVELVLEVVAVDDEEGLLGRGALRGALLVLVTRLVGANLHFKFLN